LDLRALLYRISYILAGCSIPVAIFLWPKTLASGGLPSLGGGYGKAQAVAQIGVLLSLVCSLFGRGDLRLLVATVAAMELVFCYFRLIVH
jgi:hypothetical protein